MTILFVIVVFFANVILAKDVVEYSLKFSPGFLGDDKPLSEREGVILTNGQYPGPTIRAKLGQRLVVHVENDLPLIGMTVHWHGITYVDDDGVFQDGADRITQCPINPGASWRYEFEPKFAGTYWWHSHAMSSYIEGAYGALVIESEADEPEHDGDLVMLVGEAPVASASRLSREAALRLFVELAPGIVAPRLELTRELLINGMNQGAELVVEHGKQYLLRVINTGYLNAQNFQIAGHRMQLVAMDGEFVAGGTYSAVSWGAFNVGQRLTFLLKADQAPGRYEIVTDGSVGPVGFNLAGLPGARGVLKYAGVPDDAQLQPARWPQPAGGPPLPVLPWEAASATPQASEILYNEWAVHGATGSQQYEPPPAGPADEVIVLRMGLDLETNTFTINGEAFQLPRGAPFYTGNKHLSHHVSVKLGSVVDLVIEQAVFAHPMHIHGYAPHQIAAGFGPFPGYDAVKHTFNLRDAPRRDTWQTPAEILLDFSGQGWSVSRFVADSPGPWMVHCHAQGHLETGMAVVLDVGRTPPAPPGFPTCHNYGEKVHRADESLSDDDSDSDSDDDSDSSSED